MAGSSTKKRIDKDPIFKKKNLEQLKKAMITYNYIKSIKDYYNIVVFPKSYKYLYPKVLQLSVTMKKGFLLKNFMRQQKQSDNDKQIVEKLFDDLMLQDINKFTKKPK